MLWLDIRHSFTCWVCTTLKVILCIDTCVWDQKCVRINKTYKKTDEYDGQNSRIYKDIIINDLISHLLRDDSQTIILYYLWCSFIHSNTFIVYSFSNKTRASCFWYNRHISFIAHLYLTQIDSCKQSKIVIKMLFLIIVISAYEYLIHFNLDWESIDMICLRALYSDHWKEQNTFLVLSLPPSLHFVYCW